MEDPLSGQEMELMITEIKVEPEFLDPSKCNALEDDPLAIGSGMMEELTQFACLEKNGEDGLPCESEAEVEEVEVFAEPWICETVQEEAVILLGGKITSGTVGTSEGPIQLSSVARFQLSDGENKARVDGPDVDSLKDNSQMVTKPVLESKSKCELCDRQFSRKSNLTRHMKTHCSETFSQCSICDKWFAQKFFLTRHMKSHSDETPYQCSICGEQFKTQFRLTSHENLHSGETYDCGVCAKKFPMKSQLTAHLIIHARGEEKPHQCSICQKKFATKSYLAVHMKLHSGDELYQCSFCEKKYFHKRLLTHHMKRHTSGKTHQCSVCDKQFLSKSQFIVHMRVHAGKTPYQCSICDKQFAKKSYLTDHLKRHEKQYQHSSEGQKNHEFEICEPTQLASLDNGEGGRSCESADEIKTAEKEVLPEPCDAVQEGESLPEEIRSRTVGATDRRHFSDENDETNGDGWNDDSPAENLETLTQVPSRKAEREISGEQFSRQSGLTGHVRSHTAENPFHCSVCDKGFETRSELTVHKELHRGTKPHQCSICDKQFATKSSFNSHIAIHSGEKYQCSICEKQFSKKYYLNSHMDVHSGKTYRCSICAKQFLKKYYLTWHTRIHNKKRV